MNFLNCFSRKLSLEWKNFIVFIRLNFVQGIIYFLVVLWIQPHSIVSGFLPVSQDESDRRGGEGWREINGLAILNTYLRITSVIRATRVYSTFGSSEAFSSFKDSPETLKTLPTFEAFRTFETSETSKLLSCRIFGGTLEGATKCFTLNSCYLRLVYAVFFMYSAVERRGTSVFLEAGACILCASRMQHRSVLDIS